MPPLNKPLFAPPPPATLDHFFTKPDASINNRSASSSAPKRVKAGLSSSRRVKHTPQRAEEIIVLDSDDSDDAPVVRPAPARKRKAKDHAAESSSSDIEVVETDDASLGTGRNQRQCSLWTNLSILLNSAGQSCSYRRKIVRSFLLDTNRVCLLLRLARRTWESPLLPLLHRHRRSPLRILSKLKMNGTQATTSAFG
jgi:hypothetical protein